MYTVPLMVNVAVLLLLNTNVPVKLKLPFLGTSPVIEMVAVPLTIERRGFCTVKPLITISIALLPAFVVSRFDLNDPLLLYSPLIVKSEADDSKPPTVKIELPELLVE